MSDDAKYEDVLDEVRDAFTASIRSTLTGLPAHEALQLADALCTRQLEILAGMRVRYRASVPVDCEAVTESWRRGLSAREVMRKHKISRAAAYKYHPNRGEKRAGGAK